MEGAAVCSANPYAIFAVSQINCIKIKQTQGSGQMSQSHAPLA
jgi:hypothetical protein